jgi:hypothetical protein
MAVQPGHEFGETDDESQLEMEIVRGSDADEDDSDDVPARDATAAGPAAEPTQRAIVPQQHPPTSATRKRTTRKRTYDERTVYKRIAFSKLKPEEQRPMSRTYHEDGVDVPYMGDADDNLARQVKEAHHWLKETGCYRTAAHQLTTAGTLRPREDTGSGTGSESRDGASGILPGYVWPLLTYERTREKSANHFKRAQARAEAAKERQANANQIVSGNQFMCTDDLKEVKRRAASGEWTGESREKKTMKMEHLVKIVREVLRDRPETQRSKNANKLMQVDSTDGTDPVSGKRLVGDGMLRQVRKAAAAWKAGPKDAGPMRTVRELGDGREPAEC